MGNRFKGIPISSAQSPLFPLREKRVPAFENQDSCQDIILTKAESTENCYFNWHQKLQNGFNSVQNTDF